ncbi:MAG: hydrogenase small subunit [Deltaproteobacteria bacterium]|jgi:[NiFe] hydrogenase small subunit|nr:hydrogenase small subunit [Deltaproteobacteria bacterium]
MRYAVGLGRDDPVKRLERRGISRREFLKYCGLIAVAMGMEPAFGANIARALTTKRRPSVVYLHNAECTGCSEALLRLPKPFIDELILDALSLDYHETLIAAAGEAAERALQQAVNAPDGFVCIVEGGIPTADDGRYGYIGDHTMLDQCAAILPKAKAVIAYGTCACFGGVQAAAPNPTGTKGINACFADQDLQAINVAGCPPNPLNLLGVVAALLAGEELELDSYNRPLKCFGVTVHEQCERRAHFDAGRFALSFASEEARAGWCLYRLGCRGPLTMNNCPKALFNDTNWPVGAGHPCIGCSEPNFWDSMSPFYEYEDSPPGGTL